MKYFYDKNSGSLYVDIYYSSLPENAVEISEEEYLRISTIAFSDEESNTVPTADQLIANAEKIKTTLRAEADSVIAPLHDAVYLDIDQNGERDRLIEWQRYRVLISRLDTSLGDNMVIPIKPS